MNREEGRKKWGRRRQKKRRKRKGEREEEVEKSGMVVLECNSVVIAPRR